MQTLFRESLTRSIITDHIYNTGPLPESPTIVSPEVPVSKSSNVNLTCLVDYGWTCPQRLFWYLNNNSAPLPESGGKYEVEVKDTHGKCKKKFILSIFNVTENDEGTYNCHSHCKYRDPMKAAIDLKVSDAGPQRGKNLIKKKCN